METSDTVFAGSIPALYDRYLGALLFEPYAEDLASRAATLRPATILETAAGTGIVTRALCRALPDAALTATDLNQAMLDIASERLSDANVTIRQADAQALPFADGSFDLVLCQFGVMFFPGRLGAYREARRVLKEGGTFLFNVWDRLKQNPVSAVIVDAVSACFPDDPPQFVQRVPFGYNDPEQVSRDLRAAGFADVRVETIAKRSVGSARDAAFGICMGTPLRAEIEARDAGRLDAVVDAATEALVAFAGGETIDAPMSAHVIAAR